MKRSFDRSAGIGPFGGEGRREEANISPRRENARVVKGMETSSLVLNPGSTEACAERKVGERFVYPRRGTPPEN